MPCAISTPRPRSTAARLHGRRAQPPSLGHAQPHRPVSRLLHRTVDAGRAGQTGRATASRVCSAPTTAISCDATRGSRCSFWNRAMRRPTTTDFRAAGIADSEVMRFEREGKRPTARPSRSASRSPSPRTRCAPQIRFATCQQHYPENFWNPAFQKHANGATGVAGVVAGRRASRSEHRGFHAAFTGARDGASRTAALPSRRRAATSR